MAIELLKQTVIENPYIPNELNGYTFPSGRQALFLVNPCQEVLFGGAMGGGKTTSGLACALQYVSVPGYSAMVFRRTQVDLERAGGLIDLSHQWLGDTDAEWDGGGLRWHFPTAGEPATLSFGYMSTRHAHTQFKGPPWQTIVFDELSTFPYEDQYRFMFSRLRRPKGMNAPIRMRATTNPGDVGGEWVRKRFIVPGNSARRMFIKSLLDDNPGLDKAAYEIALSELDPVTYAQMRHGDWNIRPEGQMFKRNDFKVVSPQEIPRIVRWCRGWDLASSVETPETPDPDYTVGVRMGIAENNDIYIDDVVRGRFDFAQVEHEIITAAKLDGRHVAIRIEREGGSAGKMVTERFERQLLMGYDCKGESVTGDKITRLRNMAAAARRGQIKMVARPNANNEFINDFLDETCAFPSKGVHDDQPDAAEKAFRELTTGGVALETGFFTASR